MCHLSLYNAFYKDPMKKEWCYSSSHTLACPTKPVELSFSLKNPQFEPNLSQYFWHTWHVMWIRLERVAYKMIHWHWFAHHMINHHSNNKQSGTFWCLVFGFKSIIRIKILLSWISHYKLCYNNYSNGTEQKLFTLTNFLDLWNCEID